MEKHVSNATKFIPAVGSKVRVLPEDNGTWLGIHEFYHDKPGTVVSVSEPDRLSGRRLITAEFQSRQKPDDLESFVFYNCEPWEPEITFATRDRMIGKTVRVVYSGSHLVHVGEVHTVTSVWDHREGRNGPSVDGITVGVTVGDVTRQWVQGYEVVEDGATLAVSDAYVPSVGDKVRITGWLTENGIVDGECLNATITAVTGDIWEAVGPLGGDYVTGPGYVFPQEGVVVETDVVPEKTYTQAEYEEITRQLERANQRVTEATNRAGMWERDFGRYAERVREEAVQRDWCSEYERVMDSIRDSLEIAEIPERITLVERRVRITGTVYRDVTVWVPDGEDADDPDNWYESNDTDDRVSDDFITDKLDSEYNNAGFDDTEVRVLR